MADPESPPLRKASHIGLWICMFIVGGFLVWQATHTKTINKHENFESGSKQVSTYKITKNYGLAFVDLALFPFTFHGCTRADKLENVTEQTTNEVDDAKQLVNSVSNDTN